MTNTILGSITNFEKYLLSSTTFWQSLSTAAITGAISSIYSTQRYASSGIYIISTIVVILHIIVFFSNAQNLKATFATFHGSVMKWALRITAMRIAYMLHYVPSEHSFVGLVFVICVWIDVVAVSRIIRLESDLWMTNSVFMAIVGRSNDLYGFTLYNWLVMLFCFPLIYIQIRLHGYKNEETKEKEG